LWALLVFGFLAIMGVEILDPLSNWMNNYDERVYKRVLSPEEREEIASIANSDRCACTDVPEEQSRILREEREQIEQMYRAKGL
jgi:hypothetical protein